MSTELSQLQVGDLSVDVVRKDIKNLHLAVYPPAGRVRIAVPLRVHDEAIRLAVITRLGWIRERQAAFQRQTRLSEREMVSGESHYYLGQRYRLRVIEEAGPPRVRLLGRTTLELRIKPGSDRAARESVLHAWYRRQLRDLLPSLVDRWAPVVGVSAPPIVIRRMKTRWGSCSADGRRIELNLELVKKPIGCLEYVLVHELIHLLERRHDDRFRQLLDEKLPSWRLLRDELNRAPLAHEDWTY